jgi:hypothetical protein
MPNQVGNITYPKKPPRYWVAAKRRLGMSDEGFGRVWWQTYSDQRRLMAWLAAPEEEWKEHGLERPDSPS